MQKVIHPVSDLLYQKCFNDIYAFYYLDKEYLFRPFFSSVSSKSKFYASYLNLISKLKGLYQAFLVWNKQSYHHI